MTPPRPPMPLARRLLLAQVLVVAAMALTVIGAAALIGPAVFAQHMAEAGHSSPVVIEHGEEALMIAGSTALGVGLAIAIIGAIVASIVMTRRIGASLTRLASGAERVTAGDYTTPIALDGADRELTQVADSFNTMAARLADTEATRRRMLTDLSHELRTPLAAISLVLEGLDDGVVSADRATTATLRTQTTRLTRLASDIRDVSAAEEGRLRLDRQVSTPSELIRSALATARPAAAAAGVRLIDANEPPGVAVSVDRLRIGQVLDNVVRNAIQHTPAGGTVRVWSEQGVHTVRIGVSDTGEGIAAADLPYLFERFYRGGTRRHDEGAGTGVGLAISRALTLAHGGTLTATSDGPGHGAEFVLTLPLAD